jgi:hypothetical protein
VTTMSQMGYMRIHSEQWHGIWRVLK